MADRPRVLILESMYHPAGEELLAQSTDIKFLKRPSTETIKDAIQGAVAVFVRYPCRFGANIIRVSTDLLVISTSGRGTDAIDVAAATDCSIAVVNNPGLGSVPVSEHTLGFMLDFAKQIGRSNVEVHQGGGFGQGHASTRFHLEGRTLGVIGCGEIGTEVVRKCTVGFRMRVLVYDPYIPVSAAKKVGGNMVVSLDELLSKSHFVSVHAELTEETRGMVDESVLRRMRPDAFFINTARGPIVQQQALVHALKEGWIAGAALDVFESEPLPPDSPLNTCDNLTMTPHVAGLTIEAREKLALSAANQILQVLRGERPPHLVNSEVWGRIEQHARD